MKKKQPGSPLAEKVYEHSSRATFDFRPLTDNRFTEPGVAERMHLSGIPYTQTLISAIPGAPLSNGSKASHAV